MSEGNSSENLPEREHEKVESELHEKSLAEIDLGDVLDEMREFNGDFDGNHLEEKWSDKFYDYLDDIENRDKENESGNVVQTEDDADNKAVEDVEKERQSDFEAIYKKYRTDLARTGLGLELTEPWGFKSDDPNDMDKSTSDERFTELVIDFKLNDGKKFLGYLDSLDKNNLTDGQAEGLKDVLVDLLMQLEQEYDTENPNDIRMVELLGNLPEIIKKYREFDFDDEDFSEDITDLEKFCEFLKRKCLREFLMANRKRLVGLDDLKRKEDGHFELEIDIEHYEPSSWHRDIAHPDRTPKEYKDRWKSAVKIVAAIGKNKNAKVFQQKIIESLKMGLEVAKKDIDNYRTENATGKDLQPKVEEYKIIMDEAYEKLIKLEGK